MGTSQGKQAANDNSGAIGGSGLIGAAGSVRRGDNTRPDIPIAVATLVQDPIRPLRPVTIDQRVWCPNANVDMHLLSFRLEFHPVDLAKEPQYYALPCACHHGRALTPLPLSLASPLPLDVLPSRKQSVASSPEASAPELSVPTAFASACCVASLAPAATNPSAVSSLSSVLSLHSSPSSAALTPSSSSSSPSPSPLLPPSPVPAQKGPNGEHHGYPVLEQGGPGYFGNHISGILRLSLTEKKKVILELYVPHGQCPVRKNLTDHTLAWRYRHAGQASIRSRFSSNSVSTTTLTQPWLLLTTMAFEHFKHYCTYCVKFFDSSKQCTTIDFCVTKNVNGDEMEEALQLEDLCICLKTSMDKWPIKYSPLIRLSPDFVSLCAQTAW